MKYERAIDRWQRTSSHHQLLTHLPLRRIRHAARASDVVGGVETQEQLDLLAAEDSEVGVAARPAYASVQIPSLLYASYVAPVSSSWAASLHEDLA